MTQSSTTSDRSEMQLFQSWSSWSVEAGHIPELPPPRFVEQILDKADVRADHTVLDIGAGIGWLAIPAAQRVKPTGTVVALEPAEDSREMLHHYSKEWHVDDRITLVEGHTENIPLDNETVDSAFARSTLIYVHDKGKAITESWRVLRPDGVLVLSEPLNRYGYLRGANFYHSGHLKGLGELGDQISSLITQCVERFSESMIDFTEHDLVDNCWDAGFKEVSLEIDRSVRRRTLNGEDPFEAISWDVRGADTQPTAHEYLSQHLSPEELETFCSYVRELFQTKQVCIASDGGRCVVRAVK